MTPDIERKINRAGLLGQQLEDLMYTKAKEGKLVAIGKDDDLLMGYWSLIFDYGKGIGCLLHHEFYAPAFALFRPLVEALVRAGVVLAGTPESVTKIRKDEFTLNFRTDGMWIDKALGLGRLMDDFLKETRGLLHSLTHSGTAQLGMRFDGDQIGANVSEDQITVLLWAGVNAAFLMTIMLAKHFNFVDVKDAAQELFLHYGEQSEATPA